MTAPNPHLPPLRAACANPTGSQAAIYRALVLALWHGATVEQINRTVGAWPRLESYPEPGDPIWHWLP